ncbi:MAG: DinB family protein [Chloroflexota bacterium]|nr:MAG: DinB family protein [Chloroflexota bacterium]
MEAKEIIKASLDEGWRYLTRSLEGLTDEEITWTPAPHSNSIAFILWHVTKAEDFWVNRVVRQGSEIDTAEGWREKLGTPDDGGTGFSEEQLQAWPTPKLEDLQAYAQAVREKTLAFVDSVTPARLLEIPEPDRPRETVGGILAHLITEIALHVGQIDYLRGVQRGLKQVNWR